MGQANGAQLPCPALKSSPSVVTPAPPPLHYTMIALKLQQFQYNRKKCFLRRLLFPMLFGPSDGPPPKGGGNCKWGEISKGGRKVCEQQ